MPQIIVKADEGDDRTGGAVMLRERVTASDFESDHFAAQLIERLGWAVGDAQQAEVEHFDSTDAVRESAGSSLARRLALVEA